MVAAEAGVGAATAYTYFSSKEHLVAEIFWRRLASSPVPPTDSPDPTVRVIAVLRQIALLVAEEPELAGAVTNALLGKDPEVKHLRLRIGREIHQRLVTALGPDQTLRPGRIAGAALCRSTGARRYGICVVRADRRPAGDLGATAVRWDAAGR